MVAASSTGIDQFSDAEPTWHGWREPAQSRRPGPSLCCTWRAALSHTRGAWGTRTPASRQATPFSPIPGPRAVHLEAPARALKLARPCPSCRCPLVSPAADSEAVSVDPWRLGGEPGRTRCGPGAATKGPPCWAVYSESSTPQGRTCRPLPWRVEGWVRLPERRTVRFRPVSPRPPRTAGRGVLLPQGPPPS